MGEWAHVLRKLDDYRWEIPSSYKPGMRVPGLVFADERMLRLMGEEQAFEQVANVATLPGIVGRSLAMPDIHWGYGFPVGGVAAFDLDEGIISPGGVGYDINCLAGDARVLHEHGYHLPIADFRTRWTHERIKCVNPHTEVKNTEILAFMEFPRPRTEVFKVTTLAGREIIATGDHPVMTPEGMRPLRDVQPDQHVSVYPFEGVPFEKPSGEILVTDVDVRRVYPGGQGGLRQTLAALRRRGLLPLTMDHPGLPYLAKLLGFVQGDGSLQIRPNASAQISFYAEPEDLEAIQQDVAALGFVPSRVYQRRRSHAIDTSYGLKTFDRTESSVLVRSTALAVLLVCLGATAGNKTTQDAVVPGWVTRAPKWIKRLVLAALFGAELSSPQTVTDHPFNFSGPVFSVSKRRDHLESGQRYLAAIRVWLEELGIESAMLGEREERRARTGNTSVRLNLQISSRPENLEALWSTVGYEYCRRKQLLASVAAQYLRLKRKVVAIRQEAVRVALEMSVAGMSQRAITAAIGSPFVNARFVARTLEQQEPRGVRVGRTFIDFWTFLQQATRGLGETGQVWDQVVRKEPVPFAGPVYDFTVRDPSHNFIANAFVVSNCGVRLLRTDLTEADVRPKLEDLVEILFRAVPSGVGIGGRIKVGMGEIDQVLKKGARWAAAQGYGAADDLEVIEAGGALDGADPDAVSQEAKKRGRGQIGTLGSGNHFLEVQLVDQIFDAAAARGLGLEAPGQVVVFIHTGSRGLGHQVCTDYLRVSERAGREHGIHLVDRQLACMPLRSAEGQRYFGAMCAAANFAWANRQLITHWVREGFERAFGKSWEHLGIRLVYDVAHNIAKIEEYEIDGGRRRVCVHRKGATRAFPAGHPEVPARYRHVGQPVFVPGDMGRYSFVAVGSEGAMRESFGSTCHGAGRVLGRKAAVRQLAGRDIAEELRRAGIVVRAHDRSLLAEEAPAAYKDVADVVAVCHDAGLSRRVARMRPIGVVKG
jgi:tRNA-splicing ligase RtcB